MEFFNPKNEVVRFQFSSFGLEELSRGKFEPEFFVPMDEGVFYEQSSSKDELIEYIRPKVFIKSNKLHDELLECDAPLQDVVYSVREVLDGVDNTARSSAMVYVHGVEVLSSSKSESGGVDVELDDVFVFRSSAIPQEEIPNRSNDDPLLVCKNGEYFRFSNGLLLVDIVEGGVEEKTDNFWCELYEVVEGEDVRVDLKKPVAESLVYVPRSVDREKLVPVDVLCDWEIPAEILCMAKNIRYSGDAQNIFILDDGMVSDETAGKSCVWTTASLPVVYSGTTTGGVGNECS